MSFNFGDIVFFKTHPYASVNQNIKIGGYPDYTSPLMIVNKRTENKSFDSITRERIGEILECVDFPFLVQFKVILNLMFDTAEGQSVAKA